MTARRLLCLIAMATVGGCDYLAPPERLADPDVITIAMVLVAGDSQAHLLAGHPYRHRSDAPPKIAATLVGPGWRAAFTRETDPRDGCGGGPTDWPIPMVCLNAALPEPIRTETAYKLEGKGPKGSFTGDAVVPAAPRILEPARVVLPGPVGAFRIPIRYDVPPEVGTLRPEVLQTVGGSAGTESEWIVVFPRELDVDRQDARIVWGYPSKFRRASLHLLGIGQRYSYFWRSNKQRVRWPKVGISGKGVYGYFDGSSKSSPIEIRLEDGG